MGRPTSSSISRSPRRSNAPGSASGAGNSAPHPTPLRPRTRPPIIATQTYQGERLKGDSPIATISVMNVYITDKYGKFPKGTRIKQMRIVQILPKATPRANNPRIGRGDQSLARVPLGVVPVEEDGSVYFKAPVAKAIYFQILDENGKLIKRMPQFWGTVSLFALVPGPNGSVNLLAARKYNGTNTVNFLMVKETALLVVQPTSLFLLGEYDGSVLTYSFNTLNGGASGTFTWTASASATPSHLITVTTPSGSEGDKITVQVDPRGLTVDSKYTGTLTVVGSGDSGTRQVPIEVLVVEDIYNSFLPMITKSCSP